MKDVNRNLLVRIASAVVLAPPIVAAVLWERPEATAIIVHLAAAITLWEFYAIALGEDPPWMRLIGVAIGSALSVTMFWLPNRADLLLALLMLATPLTTVLHLLARRGDVRRAVNSSGLTIFGVLYVPLLLTTLALLKRMPEGGDWVLLTLMITFLSDTGAYAAGRTLGKHKLYPAISPGKTVEGAIGGLLAAFGAAVLAKLWFMPQIGWVDAALLGIPGSALGQLGDLVESMIKRAYQVKDSGRIIPGHGGLLDRVDALLFVGAHVYLYAAHVFFRVSA